MAQGLLRLDVESGDPHRTGLTRCSSWKAIRGTEREEFFPMPSRFFSCCPICPTPKRTFRQIQSYKAALLMSWDGKLNNLYHFVPFCPTLTFRPVCGLPDDHTVSQDRAAVVRAGTGYMVRRRHEAWQAASVSKYLNAMALSNPIAIRCIRETRAVAANSRNPVAGLVNHPQPHLRTRQSAPGPPRRSACRSR